MRLVKIIALSILFCLFLISCGGSADEPATPVDAGQDAGAAGSDDTGFDDHVICECDEETFCCDGCNPINVGEECGDENLLCTDSTCTETGVCEQTVLVGWCLMGDGTAEAPWQCADTATDSANCGTCGHICPEGAVCVEGDCIIEVTGITVEPVILSLPVGDQYTLTAAIIPANASDKRVTWVSDDETVATVDEDGTVTAVEQGVANITVTTVDGEFSASAAITVVVPVTGVTLPSQSLTLFPLEADRLLVTINPAEATDQTVVWESADPGVATVDEDGLIEGVGVGETTITVRTEDGGHTASIQVTVTPVPAGYEFIQAGTFTMGSPESEPGRDDNETQHQVTITRPFLMMTTPVTQSEWEALRGNNPSHFDSCGSDCPVEKVSWHQALDYANILSASEELTPCFNCSELNGSVVCILKEQYAKPQDCPGYRLPTEAEWEYAARAGSTTAFHTGDITSERTCSNMDNAGWYHGNSKYEHTTHPVGRKQPNDWGLYDMHGNVWEWDWYTKGLGSMEVTDPYGPASGSNRVLRGGSWQFNAKDCRAANRTNKRPDYHGMDVGLRLVRTL